MSNPTQKSLSENKAEVFVSYSHKDEKWKDMLEPYLRALQHCSGITYWDDRQISTGEDWYPNIQEEMENAKVAICLISVNYLASDFIQKEEIPFLLEKRQKKGMLLIPILVESCPWKIVRWLKNIQMTPRDGRCLSKDFQGTEDEIFNEVIYSINEHIGEKTKEIVQETEEVTPEWNPLGEDDLDINRLPVTGAELFGRDKELNALDEFWEKETTNVVSFVAWGGVGKSTLINKWLQYMDEDNYRGAKKVFGWSFYSQGTNEKVTSADRFIREALDWFGDENPDEGSAWDKGKRLGKLIGQDNNLLILDGMEPLQSGHDFEKGKIKDPGLEMLLKQLTRKNEGLCVVTTREEIPDMKKLGATYQEIELDQISKEAGRALLRIQGVCGTDAKMEAVVEKFGNHALAINLLGSYLRDIPGHPISEANKIKSIRVKDKKSKHPRRVIQAWEKRLGESPELNILRIMGLFDRPADEGAVEALRKKPSLKCLNDHLNNKNKFLKALKRLRNLNLIAKESHLDPGGLDAHPIIRQHFAEELEQRYPQIWKKANNRVYQFYKSTADEFPDSIEGMQKLFFAITHSCLAGKYKEAYYEIYLKRVQRDNEAFLIKKLGAYGVDLALLAQFFKKKWSKPIPNFKVSDQSEFLNQAGFNLRALGYLLEAIEPIKVGLKADISKKNLKGASTKAGNLSELHLVLGKLVLAKKYGGDSVKFAEQSGDTFLKIEKYTTLADANFQLGHLDIAEKQFIKAENIQEKYYSQNIAAKHHVEHLQINHQFLISLRGFLYCELLFDKKKFKEVYKRVQYSKKIAEKHKWLLDIALDTLLLGRYYFSQSLKVNKNNFEQASKLFNQAVNRLRKAGQQDYLPLGLLARAGLRRKQKNWFEAQEDLDEVFDLTIPINMKYHECDAHLEQARLYLAQGKKKEAKPHVDDVRKLIEDTGYHRRDSALVELEKQIE
jgi:hypothetical protein